VGSRKHYLRESRYFLDPKNLLRKPRLQLIHVGKCGGTTLRLLLGEDQWVERRFRRLKITHIHVPVFSPSDMYVFAVRNPISRLISAFNWRWHLVVELGRQAHRFPGERDVLVKYGTLSKLAESLYVGGELVGPVVADFNRSIISVRGLPTI